MWRIQLTITINFISSKDNDDEEHMMHSKGDNKEIIINDKAHEVVEFFESSFNRYQNNLEALMKSSEFVFNYVHVWYYKYLIINKLL